VGEKKNKVRKNKIKTKKKKTKCYTTITNRSSVFDSFSVSGPKSSRHFKYEHF